LSNFVARFWWVFFLFIIIVFVSIKYIRKDPKGRYLFDKFLLNLPSWFGAPQNCGSKVYPTLGTLITSGVPILEGWPLLQELQETPF